MRILLVEDNHELAEVVRATLEKEKYKVELAHDGEKALDLGHEEEYDLILLDLMLPGISGFDILRQWRQNGLKTPVLVLSAMHQVEDKVQALDRGADDYLSKPFALPELQARIRALLRRKSEVKISQLVCGRLKIDTAQRLAFVGEQKIDLTAKEFSILEFLMYNKNQVLSRLQIAEHVWGDAYDIFSQSNMLDVHIKNLRKKIHSLDPEENSIETVRSVGYKLNDNQS